MKITKREVTHDELEMMKKDFRKIEIAYGVPEQNTRRLNVTVENDNGEIIGFASGLTNHKWFNLTDLWIHEKCRKQGLGSKILKMLEQDIKAVGIKHIYTRTTGFDKNDVFYEKQGYKKFVTFENFFEVDGGHHFGLRKDL